MTFKPKDQIAYVPSHIRDCYRGSMVAAIQANAEGIELGFVTSTIKAREAGDTPTIFCRFWSPFGPRLRTSANSEGCSPDDLIPYKHTEDYVIDAICRIKEYGIALGK